MDSVDESESLAQNLLSVAETETDSLHAAHMAQSDDTTRKETASHSTEEQDSPVSSSTSTDASHHPTNSEAQYSMNVSDYQLGAVIGFGSSAIVYMATYVPLSVDVAVKMIELDHFERNRIDELRKEIQVMAFCKHPNLLGILTSFVHESKLWIVTPFLAGGSCLDTMKTGFRDGFEEAVIATILVQALQGLDYLHDNGHIHRDVKCGNLLMAEDGLVQLADFGVSSSLMEDGERHGVRKTYVGTPCWMAPEVMEITRGYDFKADIWSFGITALELAYGHAPYARFPPMKVIYLTLSGKPPTLDRKHSAHKYSRALKDMIDSCLQRDPHKRPTAKALLRHPFFRTSAKKHTFLTEAVLARVPPVNLRDKSAQLRARGLPFELPLPTQGDAGGDHRAGGPNPATPLADLAASYEPYSTDTAESWDFSLDNSAGTGQQPPSAFDVIAEEDELVVADEASGARGETGNEVENAFAPTEMDAAGQNQLGEHGENASTSSSSPVPPAEDVLPDARRLLEDSEEGGFAGLQKNRTSRFIIDAGELDRSERSEDGSVGSQETTHGDIVGGLHGLALGSVAGDEEAGSGRSFSPTASGSASLHSQHHQSHLHSLNHQRSTSPNDDVSVPTEVKKGRFSVLEAVNVVDEDPLPDGSASAESIAGAPSSPSTAIESGALAAAAEEKRSRFEVCLHAAMAPADTDAFAGDPNEHFVSAEYCDQLSLDPATAAAQFCHQPQSQHPGQNHGYLYPGGQPGLCQGCYGAFLSPPALSMPVYPPTHGHFMVGAHASMSHGMNGSTTLHPQSHRPSLNDGSIPVAMMHHPSLYAPHGHHSNLTPLQSGPFPLAAPQSPGNANPAQLDHLFHVTDYIRTQLLELKQQQDLAHMLELKQQQEHFAHMHLATSTSPHAPIRQPLPAHHPYQHSPHLSSTQMHVSHGQGAQSQVSYNQIPYSQAPYSQHPHGQVPQNQFPHGHHQSAHHQYYSALPSNVHQLHGMRQHATFNPHVAAAYEATSHHMAHASQPHCGLSPTGKLVSGSASMLPPSQSHSTSDPQINKRSSVSSINVNDVYSLAGESVTTGCPCCHPPSLATGHHLAAHLPHHSSSISPVSDEAGRSPSAAALAAVLAELEAIRRENELLRATMSRKSAS